MAASQWTKRGEDYTLSMVILQRKEKERKEKRKKEKRKKKKEEEKSRGKGSSIFLFFLYNLKQRCCENQAVETIISEANQKENMCGC